MPNFNANGDGVQVTGAAFGDAGIALEANATLLGRRSLQTFVPWSASLSYQKFDYAFGSDGNIYQSSVTGANLNHNPVGDAGAHWNPVITFPGAPAFLHASNNLSDVASAGTARTNLGLGSAATHANTDFDAAGAAATAQSNAIAASAPVASTVPTGGNTSQVLTKNSNTNYDMSWADAGGGGGGTPDLSEVLGEGDDAGGGVITNLASVTFADTTTQTTAWQGLEGGAIDDVNMSGHVFILNSGNFDMTGTGRILLGSTSDGAPSNPATPSGWMTVHIFGAGDVKIPYYT